MMMATAKSNLYLRDREFSDLLNAKQCQIILAARGVDSKPIDHMVTKVDKCQEPDRVDSVETMVHTLNAITSAMGGKVKE